MLNRKGWVFIAISLMLALSGCAPKAAEPQVAPQKTETPAQTEVSTKATVQKISPVDAKARLDAGEEIILIDVRTKEEFDSGYIPGALLLPVDQLQKRAGEVMPDLEATYFVYCRSGNRSGVATQLMVDLGYQNVFDLGGILDWSYEITKP